MKIENGSLVVTLKGVDKAVALPTVAADAKPKAWTVLADRRADGLLAAAPDAKLKVWTVPTDYRAEGLFVAITENGQPEEIPACDLSATEFLGELALDAGDEARLQAAKAARRTEINAACDAAVAVLAAAYPEREVQSWPQQVKEAEALAADPQAPAPLLAAIAQARGIPVAQLASRVLAKMVAYAAASGALIGRRQAAESLIDRASSVQDVASVVW